MSTADINVDIRSEFLGSSDDLPVTEVGRLRAENAALRKRIARAVTEVNRLARTGKNVVSIRQALLEER